MPGYLPLTVAAEVGSPAAKAPGKETVRHWVIRAQTDGGSRVRGVPGPGPVPPGSDQEELAEIKDWKA